MHHLQLNDLHIDLLHIFSCGNINSTLITFPGMRVNTTLSLSLCHIFLQFENLLIYHLQLYLQFCIITTSKYISRYTILPPLSESLHKLKPLIQVLLSHCLITTFKFNSKFIQLQPPSLQDHVHHVYLQLCYNVHTIMLSRCTQFQNYRASSNMHNHSILCRLDCGLKFYKITGYAKIKWCIRKRDDCPREPVSVGESDQSRILQWSNFKLDWTDAVVFRFT